MQPQAGRLAGVINLQPWLLASKCPFNNQQASRTGIKQDQRIIIT
jgi:hypothetical protein